MRVYLTGATGFVGSNIARVFTERHGAELFCPVRESRPPAGAPYDWAVTDVRDASAVAGSVRSARPDVIVHAAILNDFRRLYTDRRDSWASYVVATRNLVDAANAVGAHVVLVSTDWVFDGTQSGATEDTPPNPINLYGFLKAASELVVTERAEGGAVARISGVNGVHWARPETPRRQDAGFGYLVASIAEALGAGQRFTVWQSPEINTVATPTLASDAAESLWRLAELGREGVFHCCGGESVDRAALARLTAEELELDPELLDFGPPDPEQLPPAPVPYDTSLDSRATAAALGTERVDVRTMLRRMRFQLEHGELGPAAAPAQEGAQEPAAARLPRLST
ncbi:MAG TPA: sugar nucleotide-binding protein [Thermoleophilaceae bacterium]